MAVIALVSAKTSPGATTTAVALALSWATPTLLVGADPGGDDVLSGYLGPWVSKGLVRPNMGLVSFAHATRHTDPAEVGDLAAHTQLLPGGRDARVLVGLTEPSQGAVVGAGGWRRLATALSAMAGPGRECDAVVDCGRFGPATPRALIEVADLVLVAVRPCHRSVMAARPLLRVLRQQVPAERLGLAVVATTARGAAEVREVLDVPLALTLPSDLVAAQACSDAAAAVPRTSPLIREAVAAGHRLHAALTHASLGRVLVGTRS